MAWLYLHPKSKRWFIGWRVAKKIFNRSTGSTDRKQAERALATYNLMSAANKQDRLTEDFYRSLTGKDVQELVLKDAITKYLDTRAVVPGTHTIYETALTALSDYVHATDTAPTLNAITSEVMQSFLNGQRTRTSAGTANNYRKVLRTFFRDAASRYNIANPMVGIKRFKRNLEEAEHQRRPFTAKELREAYAVASPFWKFAMVTAFFTGLRLGRIATLRWRNVDLGRWELRLADNKHPDGKPLITPVVSSTLRRMLRDLRTSAGKAKPDGFLYPTYAGLYLRKPGGDAAPLSREFRDEVLVKAGLCEAYQDREQGTGRSCKRPVNELSFHSLKHSMITELKASGAPQMVAREMVGHDSDAVSDIYTHVSPELKRRALRKLPEVFR